MEALEGLETGKTYYGSFGRIWRQVRLVMEALEGSGDRYNFLWKLWKDLETGITCYGSFGRIWSEV